MTNYINLDTNEYPRHDGDIALNPNANWVEVEETIPPSPSSENKIIIEDFPAFIENKWIQIWKEVDAIKNDLPKDTFTKEMLDQYINNN